MTDLLDAVPRAEDLAVVDAGQLERELGLGLRLHVALGHACRAELRPLSVPVRGPHEYPVSTLEYP